MNTEEHISKERQRRRRLIEEVAPLVDARLKSTAQSMPDRIVGEWRGKSIVDTAPLRPGAGKPVTAAELARYTVVFANAISNEVFAFCHRHQTAYSTYSQGDARCNAPKTWCPGCSSDPSWPPGIADPAVVAAENQAREQRIEKIKASRKTRIVQVTEIALERGTVSSQQAAQLLGIWDEIQTARTDGACPVINP